MNESVDLISIIVPVYNVESYLRDCLDSIAVQTYPNLEVLIIDDGSTDRSGSICDQYASLYPSFQVFHQKNGGLSAARNSGLDRMHGKWVVFVDSDDYIHPDMVRVLHETAVKDKVPMVRCSYRKSALNRSEYVWNISESKATNSIKQESAEEEMKNILCNRRTTVVWGAIYRKDLMHVLRFPAGYTFEDTVFMPAVLYEAKTISLINEEYCVYRQVPSSICHKETPSTNNDSYEMAKKRTELVRDLFPKLYGLALSRFWSQMMNLYNKCINHSQSESAESLIKKLKRDDMPDMLPWNVLFNRQIPFHNRILLLGCKISFTKTSRIKNLFVR